LASTRVAFAVTLTLYHREDEPLCRLMLDAKEKARLDRLWEELLDGAVDIVASDHSPAPPEMKTGGFFQIWGGIAGVQSTVGVNRDGPLQGLDAED